MPLIDPFVPVSGPKPGSKPALPGYRGFLESPESRSAAAKPAYLKEAFRKWLLDGAIK